MAHVQLADTLTALDRVDDLAELNVRFRREAQVLGFTAYAAGQIAPYDAHRPFLLLDWPRRWMELYAAQGFAREDLALVIARQETRTFSWDEIRRRWPGAQPRIWEAVAAFGWQDGLVVPVRGPGRSRGVVSLAAPAPLAFAPGERLAIETIAVASYVRARELVDTTTTTRPSLTPRERETLACVASGRSDSEIAALLGISITTAHAHIERAKTKLGAGTRAQAVAVAMSRGWLDSSRIL